MWGRLGLDKFHKYFTEESFVDIDYIVWISYEWCYYSLMDESFHDMITVRNY